MGGHQREEGGGREIGLGVGGRIRKLFSRARSPNESQEDSGMEGRGPGVSRGVTSDSAFVTNKMQKSDMTRSRRKKLLRHFLAPFPYVQSDDSCELLWTEYVSQNAYFETLTPNVMVSGSRAFWR